MPLSGKSKDTIKWFYIIFTVLVITYMLPKEGRFQFEFEKGKVWQHPDLRAPFTFPILKKQAEFNTEKEFIKKNKFIIISKKNEIGEVKLAKLKKDIEQDTKINNLSISVVQTELIRSLKQIYDIGIFNPDSISVKENTIINFWDGKQYQEANLDEFISIHTLKDNATKYMEALDSLNGKESLLLHLQDAITSNILYDTARTNAYNQEMIDKINPYNGFVEEGVKIISQSSVVDDEKYQKLISLKKEFELGDSTPWKIFFIWFGEFLLISFLMGSFLFQLKFTQKEVYTSVRSIILILSLILIMVFATSFLAKSEWGSIYLIPYCMVPIVLLAFFNQRVSIIAHILNILICALLVNNSFEFILIQISAGFIAILSMLRIRYLSQFFVSAGWILLTYLVIYFSYALLHANSWQDINFKEGVWFLANFILILLSYPFIFANEKLLGLVSDISLLEYSDINNKVLKELSAKAPGTFQHSLQVANLAEAIIDEIGGNALLTRVGALYHDIGKMHNPEYFIENQTQIDNPHNKLENEQSAEIIIKHVSLGIKLAEENKFPARMIDFIKMHHGTTRVEYFYQGFIKKHPNEYVDEGSFRYPGPKPNTRETAVVMLVDSVEAASHSLKEPTEDALENLIDQIIDHKIDDRQLSEAPITLKEVETTRRMLKKMMKSVYHIRIAYPSEKK